MMRSMPGAALLFAVLVVFCLFSCSTEDRMNTGKGVSMVIDSRKDC